MKDGNLLLFILKYVFKNTEKVLDVYFNLSVYIACWIMLDFAEIPCLLPVFSPQILIQIY